MRVEVSIDEVVLRGVPRGQADAVVTAFVKHLRHGHARISRRPAANAEALGARAAGEVWRAIRGGGR